MRILIIALLLLAAGIAYAVPTYRSPLVELPPGKAAARSGTCSYPAGGWAIVNCSDVAAAASSELNPWSRYVIQCGVDSYVAWGTSSVAADANDGYAPSKSWVDFMTTDTVRYVSCLNIGSDSDCRIIECL